MQIVIDIPEEVYNSLQDNDYCGISNSDMYNAIKNGIPIPKGHGDLIDRKELKKDVYTTTEWNGDIHRIIYEASVDDAKPIIEADEESEEK